MATNIALDQGRWQQLCQRLGVVDKTAITIEFARMVAAYGEPQRFYHTAQHIGECLRLLDWLMEIREPEPPALLEMALWYHDVVYQPQASNNERCSAEQAVEFLHAHHIPWRQIEVVKSLIMATCHCGESVDTIEIEATQWMVDIDLAILGTSPQRFTQYETQIRQEYAWVPAPIYQQKRQTVLRQFLERPNIYQSLLFQQKFERQARRNLSKSLI